MRSEVYSQGWKYALRGCRKGREEQIRRMYFVAKIVLLAEHKVSSWPHMSNPQYSLPLVFTKTISSGIPKISMCACELSAPYVMIPETLAGDNPVRATEIRQIVSALSHPHVVRSKTPAIRRTSRAIEIQQTASAFSHSCVELSETPAKETIMRSIEKRQIAIVLSAPFAVTSKTPKTKSKMQVL